MVFSSLIFLFAFLPLSLLLYYGAGQRARNIVMFAISLLFYAWGEVFYTGIILVSIVLNYIFGRLLEKAAPEHKKVLLLTGVGCNLLPLLFFKYGNWLGEITAITDDPQIHLPIGISFFTFQAISYIIDVFRGETTAQKRFIDLGVYITSFPQLIAGPIVRYKDVAEQISSRRCSLSLFREGVEDFLFGMSRKVLLANPLALVADTIFNQPAATLSSSIAWLGILCYTLQIYFDFSGYSEMAVGLGKMFGFHFPDNFNFPYIARSMKEFWRRWHISLSAWFRDYLYIPLGGNRRGERRTWFNLFTVFVLCGLWHGASWNFLVWGLLHGLFLSVERHPRVGAGLSRLPLAARHLYTMAVVVNAWVFFRVEGFANAVAYLGRMYSFANFIPETLQLEVYTLITPLFLLTFATACLFSTTFGRFLWARIGMTRYALFYKGIILVTLSGLCILSLAAATYNPFIYFRF